MFEANSIASVKKQEKPLGQSSGASKAKKDVSSVEYIQEIHVTSK
jgi:hypothetical protein